MGFPNFQIPGLSSAIQAAIAAGGTRDMTGGGAAAPPPQPPPSSTPYSFSASVPQTQAQRNAMPDTGNNYVQGNAGLENASAGDFASSMTSGNPWNMISSSPAGYNQAQYADPRFAQGLAQNLGANVINTRTIDSGAGRVPSQAMLDFGGGFAGNAGLIGQNFAKYGPDVAMRMLQDEMRSSGGGFNPASQNAGGNSMFQEQTNTGPTQMNAAFGQAAGGPMQRIAPNNPNPGQANVQAGGTPNPLAQQGMWGQGGNQQNMFGGGFGGPMPFGGGMSNMNAMNFNQFGGGGFGSPMGMLGGQGGGNMGGLGQMLNMIQQLRQGQGFRRRPQFMQRRGGDSNYFSRFG